MTPTTAPPVPPETTPQRQIQAGKRRRHKCKRHRGVTLVTHRTGWQGRWVNPITQRSESVLLHRLGRTTEESCCKWAIEKRASMAKQRSDLDLYGTVKSDMSVTEAADGFVSTKRAEGLRERSVTTLRDRLRPFVDWCGARGIDRLNRVSPADVAAYREHVLHLPARRTLGGEGAGRGAKVLTEAKLSGTTRRSLLGGCEYLLRECSALPADAVRKALAVKKVQVVRRPIVYFDNPRDIAKTVSAAARLDGADARPLAGPLVLVGLLAGLRRGEIARLAWSDVDLEANDGKGVIRLDESTKTKIARRVGLDVSPVLKSLFAALKLRSGDHAGLIFDASFQSVQRRLRRDYGAPSKFNWQVLRRTCAAYSCSAPGVFGSASAFMSAKRLGHGVGVSERYYADAVSGIDPKATTLEAAMGIESLAAKIVAAVKPAARKRRAS